MGVMRDQFGNPKKEQSQNLAENLPLKKVIDNYIRSKYAKFKNPGKHSKQKILQSVPFYLCTLILAPSLPLSISLFLGSCLNSFGNYVCEVGRTSYCAVCLYALVLAHPANITMGIIRMNSVYD